MSERTNTPKKKKKKIEFSTNILIKTSKKFSIYHIKNHNFFEYN